MKKLVQIAVEGNTGSTGTIAEAIGELVIKQGWESYIAHGRFARPSKSQIIRIGSDFDVILHGVETRLFDRHCLGSRNATKKLVKQIKQINPDIVHLHHLHGYYINIEILFDYLSTANIPVVWTFHDCWSFTGHCAYFDSVGCEKWKTECNKCPQKRQYPASLIIDRSKKNYYLKKKLFTSVEQMVLVPVSNWLERLIKESFFANTEVFTIHNGIDTSIFKPQDNQIKIRKKYNLEEKFVIIGVASPWVKRKGFFDFIELSKHLNDDERIILIGLDKNQIKQLPNNIIGLSKTENKQQLIDLYSSADLFLNLTWEDNFPTTNIEALACGTPVATYNTGGSVEAVTPETGFVVEQGSISNLLKVIKKVKSKGKKSYTNACRNRAKEHYSKGKQFSKYLDLYDSLLNK